MKTFPIITSSSSRKIVLKTTVTRSAFASTYLKRWLQSIKLCFWVCCLRLWTLTKFLHCDNWWQRVSVPPNLVPENRSISRRQTQSNSFLVDQLSSPPPPNSPEYFPGQSTTKHCNHLPLAQVNRHIHVWAIHQRHVLVIACKILMKYLSVVCGEIKGRKSQLG